MHTTAIARKYICKCKLLATHTIAILHRLGYHCYKISQDRLYTDIFEHQVTKWCRKAFYLIKVVMIICMIRSKEKIKIEINAYEKPPQADICRTWPPQLVECACNNLTYHSYDCKEILVHSSI